MAAHRDGEPAKHGSFSMSSPGKRKVREAWLARKSGAPGPSTEDPDAEFFDLPSDDESEDESCPIGSVGSPRLLAKAKKQKKAAKEAAKAARAQEREDIERLKSNLARGGRAAQRAIRIA